MPTSALHYTPQLMRMARISVAVAVIVLSLKFAAWAMTGSVALYSDALESIVNVVTGLAAWWALAFAQRPADANHPLGHQKAEYLSAVLEGVLISVAAALIIHDAVRSLLAPVPLVLPPLAIAISVLATAVNGYWARRLISAGRRARSPAIEADGRHLMSDVVTTLGVLAGLALAAVFGWPAIDPAIALLVAVHLLMQGWSVIRASLAGLLDEAIEEDELETVAQIIETHAAGALEIHDLVTRRSGPVTFIEFHLIVDGMMTVRQSHVICDRIERALREEDPGARITIHVEPEEMAKPSGRVIA